MLPMTIGIKIIKVVYSLDALGGKNRPKRVFLSLDVIIDSLLKDCGIGRL